VGGNINMDAKEIGYEAIDLIHLPQADSCEHGYELSRS
jgi:hypothetical protein